MSDQNPTTGGIVNENDRRRIIDQIDIWRKQLINLARSNRLLYFRHTRTSTLEILDEEANLASVVAKLLAGRACSFHVPEDLDGSDDDPEASTTTISATEDELITSKTTPRDLSSTLRTLDRRATQEFMEKGIWILYLAAGILSWTDPDTDEQAESPLILVPVQLHRASPRDPYELRRVEEEVVFNPALSVKLAEFGVELPSIDEEELEFISYLTECDRAISAHPNWEVQRRLVIGPFSFHKEVMYRDLLRNEAEIADHLLVQALAVGARDGSGLDFDVIPEERLDEECPPEDIAMILDADATQLQCITAAVAGRSFVMDGPPGSGKSQTIANMIAELLAQGKTILFVSEKAAALEVVHKRLWAAGLGDYCLELHSHKATRKEVAKQLGKALEFHPAVPATISDSSLAQLVARRTELSERSTAMNELRRPLGRSLHDVIGRVAQLQRLQQAPPPPALGSGLSAEALIHILNAAKDIARSWGPVERGEDFVWRDLTDTVLDAARNQRVRAQIDNALAHVNLVSRMSADAAAALLLRAPHDFDSTESFARVLRHLASRPEGVLGRWLSERDLEETEAILRDRRQLSVAHGRGEKALLEIVGSHWRDVSEETASQAIAEVHRLRSLEPPLDASGASSIPRLEAMLSFLVDNPHICTAIKVDAHAIGEAFGIPTSELTVVRAAELAELGLISRGPVHPEPEWINPARLPEIEQAVEILQPLCLAFNDWRERLGHVFTDDVLAVDLESLCNRFQSAHSGLHKLRSTYRDDKRTVASVSRAGKATKEILALLPHALEWQRKARELKAAENREAHHLGKYFYRSTETDFDLIHQCLASVRRAIEIAGYQLQVEAMRRQLGRGGNPDPNLLMIAERLTASVERWWNGAASLGQSSQPLEVAPLDFVAEWSVQALTPLKMLVDAASALGEVAGRPLQFEELERCFEARSTVTTIEGTFAAHWEADRSKLGEAYQGLDTNWDALESAIDWTARLREMLGSPASLAIAERLAEVELNWSELDAALDDWHRSRDVILANFAAARAEEVRSDLNTTFSDAIDLLNHLAATIADVDEWIEFRRARDLLVDLDVREVIDFCESARIQASEVPEIVERACLERWADAIIEEDRHRLGHLRADQLNPVLDQFRELDRELISRAAGRVIASCNQRRPRTTVGAPGIIKREAEKQKRHMPVRVLLEQTGEVAQVLKPCFMMSPLTVSQFLPPSLHFDAVIFDEASQVRPCDAINCIYRGSQLIIAGDDKQLPPTSFFESVMVDSDDEWEEEQFDEFESIIKLGKGSTGLQELPLKWHYRSQHEDLIAYSNFSFYDGRLITFPGAVAEADDLGVKFIPVEEGIYRRGTARDNPKEAEVVVERVLHWAKVSLANPDRAATLGVVAFSEAQAEAIEVALDRRRQILPELDSFFAEDRLDGFFIKNLENVQGDERDVMIFSVGYGRDENAKLTMNFGPLNREGGERRLNVAITRARRRVELVASITGTEPEFSSNLGSGARHLQRYLDYAARGPIALAIDIGADGLDAESPFEEEVIRTIHSWGYKVKPQVGTAGYRVDIGVWHPSISGRFALGVECDGRMYHSSRVARDRDRLRQEILEGLGWRIYRIWGTSWYRYRSEQEERLKTVIEEAINDCNNPSGQTQQKPPTREKLAEERFEPVPLDQAKSWTEPYRVAELTRPHYLVEMHLPEAQFNLRRMILEVVDIEGPIEDELLLRRVREAWGVGRAGQRIRNAFSDALQSLVRRRDINRLERSFTYTRADQLGRVRVPGENERTLRNVAQIPRAEQMAAVKHLIADAHRVSRNELTFEICRLFGWNRRGPDIAVALNEATDALLAEGAIVDNGEFLTAP